ncbi:unnamed protein product [Zymoseptoria tritici ST99CH_3D1]|nr:unnamed protein product [Zymoseptoria tritici ST99CH_3D1]
MRHFSATVAADRLHPSATATISIPQTDTNARLDGIRHLTCQHSACHTVTPRSQPRMVSEWKNKGRRREEDEQRCGGQV